MRFSPSLIFNLQRDPLRSIIIDTEPEFFAVVHPGLIFLESRLPVIIKIQAADTVTAALPLMGVKRDNAGKPVL